MPAETTSVPVSPSGALAWEAQWRTRVVIATVLAALLPVIGAIIGTIATKDDATPNNSIDRLLYFHEHGQAFLLSAVIQALGAAAIAATLVYLYRAVKARRPELPPVALVCSIGGPALVIVAQIALQVYVVTQANSYVAKNTLLYTEAHDVFGGGTLQGLSALGLGAQLALGFAFVILSLNAMRVGLLARFNGILGIIVGVLFVIPLGTPLPVVQAFWLLSLAYLISGRWPGGVPPSWLTGKAEPWPSQQELREARAGSHPATVAEPELESEELVEDSDVAPHPSSKKRKRKRKR